MNFSSRASLRKKASGVWNAMSTFIAISGESVSKRKETGSVGRTAIRVRMVTCPSCSVSNVEALRSVFKQAISRCRDVKSRSRTHQSQSPRYSSPGSAPSSHVQAYDTDCTTWQHRRGMEPSSLLRGGASSQRTCLDSLSSPPGSR